MHGLTVTVQLPEDERAFYEAVRRRAMDNIAALDGPPGQRKIHILAEIGKLRRLCCHPALIDPKTPLESAKLASFLELTDELLRNATGAGVQPVPRPSRKGARSARCTRRALSVHRR